MRLCYDEHVNKGALKKCEHMLEGLRPIAKRFDGGPHGAELSSIDDDWRVGILTDEGLPISNTRTDHGTTLG